MGITDNGVSQYLTPDQFADQLRQRGIPYSGYTMRLWARTGKLKTLRIGRKILIVGTELDRVLAEGLK